MIESILTITSGGLAGGIVTYVAREWISTRLRSSIQHEYDVKLQNHRDDFNLRIASIGHQNEMHQLKTSLFFDHQRTAYMKILEAIHTLCRDWVKNWDAENGDIWGVSEELYHNFDSVVSNNLLFLDRDLEYIVSAIKFRLGNASSNNDDKYIDRRTIFQEAYVDISFMKLKLAEQFRNKIGIQESSNALVEVALLMSRIELSRYIVDLSSEGIVKVGYSKIHEIIAYLKEQIEESEKDLDGYNSFTSFTIEQKQRLKYLEAYVSVRG